MADLKPPSYDAYGDEELIQLFRDGHARAFPALMERYKLELFHFLIRFCGDRQIAEDLFQEAFAQVYQSLPKFDTTRRFKPWLFTIAANKARDHLRRVGKKHTLSLQAPVDSSDRQGGEMIDLLEGDIPGPDEHALQEDLKDQVRRAVMQMPDHLREVLTLAYFQQLSYKEVAEILNLPVGTVKSRLHAAVAHFSQAWKRKKIE
jgi:RNA polymerase sigma-70 factor (ECF subfamily)